MNGTSARGGFKRQVLADHVYDELMESLVDGRLEAGAPLNIDALSRELEVSQTPIREALARLEATGLVHRLALKGYRVAPLFTPEDLAHLTDARLLIEPENAFLACQRMTDALVALRAMLQVAQSGGQSALIAPTAPLACACPALAGTAANARGGWRGRAAAFPGPCARMART